MTDPLNLLSSGGVPDAAEPVAGLNLLAAEKPAPLKEGFGAGVSGVKANLFGAGALVARGVGATGAEEKLLAKSAAAGDEAAAHSRKIEDVDWTSPTSIGNHFKYLLGNAVPSLALMAAGGAAARGVGAAAGFGAKALNRATMTGAVVPDVALEAGGIFPEAIKTGVENPGVRAAVGGAAAASLDFVPLLAAEKYLAAAGKGGFGAVAKGAAKGAPVGAALEGGQETLQAVIERAAAGQDITGPEALSDYLNSFAGGAVPGAGFGAVIGGHRAAQGAPVQQPSVFTEREQAPAVNTPVPDSGIQNTPTEVNAPVQTAPEVEQPPLALVPKDEPLSLVPTQTPLEEAWTVHNALEAQHDGAAKTLREATTHLETLDAQIKKAGRRVPAALASERSAVAAMVDSATTAMAGYAPKLEQAKAAIQREDLLANTPSSLNPAIKAKPDAVESDVIQTKPAPEAEQVKKAVEGVHAMFRDQGMLLTTTQESLATPPKTAREVKLDIVNQRSGRTVDKAPDEKTRQGAVETAAVQAAQPQIEALGAAAALPSRTISVLKNAIVSIAREAAAMPTTEAAQQHIATEVPKALKGRVKAVDAVELAASMVNAVGQSRTLYSKGAAQKGARNFKKLTADEAEELSPAELDQAIAYFTSRATFDTRGSGFKSDADGMLDFLEDLRDSRGTQHSKGAVDASGVVAALMNDFGGNALNAADYADAKARTSTSEEMRLKYQAAAAVLRAGGPKKLLSVGMTSEQFYALPAPAKAAAVDAYDAAMADLGTALRARLTGIIGRDPNLTINTFVADIGSPIGGYTRVDSLKSVVSMALNAKDGLSIADHEGFHYAEDHILDARERQVVRNAFAPGSRMFKQLIASAQTYDQQNGTRIADEIAGTPAEARAYGFEFWRRGELKAQGAIAQVFEKLLQFFESIGNAVKGLGFKSMEDIFTALDRGQFAERARNPGQTSERAGDLRSEGAIGDGKGRTLVPADIQEVYAPRSAPDTLYSQAAADIDRSVKAGELQEQQLYDQFNKMQDNAKLPDELGKAAMGAVWSETGGNVSRWFKKNILTPNFISRQSEGYKNVYRTLNTYGRYKAVLVERMLKEQMPSWYDATQVDREASFGALLKRTTEGYTRDSKEFADLMVSLTPEQRSLFAQATKMIAGFLDKELEVDTAMYERNISNPEERQQLISDRAEQVQSLKDTGYVPLQRYGDHTVHVYKDAVKEDGTPYKQTAGLLFFDRSSTAEVTGKMYEDEIARSGAGLKVEVGTHYKSARDTTVSVQQFLDTARRNGVPLTSEERERIVKALSQADSLMRNRLMRRKTVPGYSKDGMRVLHEFGVRTAGKIAYANFAPAIDAAADGFAVESDIVQGEPVVNIDQDRSDAKNLWKKEGPMSGFHHNLADELTDYVLVPDHTGGWSRKLRGAAMAYFIGGSISGGMVNAMSVPMMVVPELSIHTNYANAFATTLGAWKDAWRHQDVLRDVTKLKAKNEQGGWAHPVPEVDKVPGLRAAMVEAADRLLDTEIHQIMGIAQGSLYSQSRGVQKAMETWMAPFRISEQTNRITAFMAAYKIGQQNGLTNQALYRFAGEAVDSTQNNYNEANRPGAARNPIFALMFMFKSFPLFMTEAIALMYKANPKSAVYMLLGLTAMTGVQGLPFAETLQDLVDTIAQRLFNSPFNSRRAMRNVVKGASEAIVGYDLSDIVLRGVINDVFGMSVSSRIGAGDFVPGSRLGTADADQGKVLESMLGAPYAMLKYSLENMGKLAGGVATGDWKQSVDALRAGAPIAVRNLIKGGQQLNDGYATDAGGKKLIDISGPSAVFQMAGIASAGVAKAYDLDKMDKQTEAFYQQVSRDMTSQMVRALKDGDADKVQSLMEARAAWNESNPEMPLMANPASIRRDIALAGIPLNARTLRMLPRALRGSSVAAEGISQ